MNRNALLGVAAAIAIGLVGSYLLWGWPRPATTESSTEAVSAAKAGSSPGATPVRGAAVIDGEVQLTGAAPVPGKLHREADPYCARRAMTDPTVLVTNGKLANVWVHVIQGAPDEPPPPTAVTVDQQDCMYTPRVTTAVVGQAIVARNDDPILHNVHTYLGTATLFNRGMPNEKAAPIEFKAVEPGMIKWKCDVHPWMRGYVGVSRNKFQAVTGTDGAFRIAQLPPGRYTIEAWHEKLGTKTLEVTAPGQVRIEYSGSEQ